MQKSNPACYECPKGKNKLHMWSKILDHKKVEMIGALCQKCGLKLTKEQAEDVWRE